MIKRLALSSIIRADKSFSSPVKYSICTASRPVVSIVLPRIHMKLKP